jgi:hypothetical protein
MIVSIDTIQKDGQLAFKQTKEALAKGEALELPFGVRFRRDPSRIEMIPAPQESVRLG